MNNCTKFAALWMKFQTGHWFSPPFQKVHTKSAHHFNVMKIIFLYDVWGDFFLVFWVGRRNPMSKIESDQIFIVSFFKFYNNNNGTHGVLYCFCVQLLFFTDTVDRLGGRWCWFGAGRDSNCVLRMVLGFPHLSGFSRVGAFLLHPSPQAGHHSLL